MRVQEEELLVANELELPLGATFAAIQTKLAQFPARTARYFVGLRDVAEIEERLRDELDADLGDLNAARFTAEDAVAIAVAGIADDPAMSALFQKLLFDGADRTALLELACSIATAGLRSIGRRVIASALHAKDLPDTAIADGKTGQVSDAAEIRESAERQTSPAPAASASGDLSQSAPQAPSSAPESRHRARTAASTPHRERPPRAKADRRKARPQTATGPAEVEAAIAPDPKPRHLRRK